ncbi:MAG: acetyl-CoA C-acyltransferase, partial [Gemmatimonadota bacterium]
MASDSNDRNVVFLSAVRTPFGTFGGSLKNHSATELGARAARAAVERAGVEADEYGHTYFGNVIQTSADAVYLARHVGL